MNQMVLKLVGARSLFPDDLRKIMAGSNLFPESVFGYRDGKPIPEGLGDVLFCKIGEPGLVFQGEAGMQIISQGGVFSSLSKLIREQSLAVSFNVESLSFGAGYSPYPIIYRANNVVITKDLDKQAKFKQMSIEDRVSFVSQMIKRDLLSYAERYGVFIGDDLEVMVDPASVEQKLRYQKHKPTSSGSHTTATILNHIDFSVNSKLMGYWAIGRLRSIGKGRVSRVEG
ncbi:MAG: hypothetical protein IBX55_12100 [Methyloprofundus sp.]|nr:hypothetical protein [Methyloprofundus sp.]